MEIERKPFHVMTKPSGAICNLDCTYCFYLEKEQLYPHVRKFEMSDETLEAYVRQYLQQPSPVVDFAWQGGEPTLMGVDFFRKAVALQQQYCPEGKQVRNMLQTNGTLLNDAWCAFLKEHDFLIGLSIDGPREVHDRYRVDKGGKATFDKVLRGLHCLQKHEVEYNLLCCVHQGNVHDAHAIYDFFQSLGASYWQFIPIVERMHGTHGVTPHSVTAEQYGDFLVTLFNRWVRNDVGRISIQIIDVALRVHVGLNPGLCIFEETCGSAMALEHNGDLYSCDHFVDPAYLLGNIHDDLLEELVVLPQQQAFGTDKRETLPQYCRDCSVRALCNGGCPKNRFIKTPDGEAGLNFLCAGYKHFFTFVAPYMQAMAAEYRRGRNPAGIMQYLRQNPLAFAPEHIGRNDPCFCSSGRKFKNCCGRPAAGRRAARA